MTTVFYNGVNIKDPELTCIISKLWDPIVNAQILGRKRPVSKQDTCAVYFKGYSSDRIKQEREHIRKDSWSQQRTGKMESLIRRCGKRICISRVS